MSGGSDTSMRRRVSVALLAVVALGAAVGAGACSGGGEAAPGESDAASAASVASPPTTPATSSTTTAGPTTTTEDPVAAAEAAAVEAVLEQGAIWVRCTRSIEACDPASLHEASSGPMLERLVSSVAQRKETGLESRPPVDSSVGERQVLDVEILNDEGTEARVSFCQVDGAILVQLGAAPDGSDVIVDDRVISALSDTFVRQEADGRWRVFDAAVVTQEEGMGGCDSFVRP